MKNKFLQILLNFSVLFLAAPVVAQVHEFGLEAGAANYFGDLNQNNSFLQPKWAVGGFYRKNYNHYFALRTSINVGQAGFDEKKSTNPYRKYQNLNVLTTFGAIDCMFEFNFFKYVVEKDTKENRFTPFIALGAGAGFFIPTAKYDNKRYALLSKHTEFVSYTPIMLQLPMAFGIKYRLKKGLTFTIETIYHQLNTDYFDDVSSHYKGKSVMDGFVNLTDPSDIHYRLGDVVNKQRGNQFKDALLLTYVSLSYTIVRTHCPMPSTDPLEVL